ncbi:AAA-like domain-containing protein [Floridanema evergladense]|uniref:AAA-like domain-containing protein n=1 Tax=Floridaenema evergladense BLCC-F167 TaxID=3153639 RepID=A0ABV4WNV7_9CYAN
MSKWRLILCLFQNENCCEKTAQEFFGLLRAWHERSKNEPTWQKLRLIIVHSKEVYIPLNINQSPFNVGLPIELPDLNSTQVTELIKRHGLNWSNQEIEQLIGMVDGHPYLVRKALYNFARGQLTLEKFLESAPTEAGIYGDHLRRHLANIKADPKLEAAMKQVISASVPVRLEQMEGFKLRSMGLVELRGNDVAPLCNLYRLYFKDMLGVR